MNKKALILPSDYSECGRPRLVGARLQALLSAHAEQIRLYHEGGRDILGRESREGWGAKVIDRLSTDLLCLSGHEGAIVNKPQIHEGYCRREPQPPVFAADRCPTKEP